MINQNDKNINEKMKQTMDLINQKIKQGTNLINTQISKISTNINSISNDYNTFKKETSQNIKENKTEFKTKVDVLSLKDRQDTIKITLDLFKKEINKNVIEWTNKEINTATKDKEREILMNLWLEELKEITDNLEEFKNMPAKDFKISVKEILLTIESFQRKFK